MRSSRGCPRARPQGALGWLGGPASHDPVLYAASSVLLGVTYGLAYPLIQGQPADSAPAGLRQRALWCFGLAYLAGLYGFPLIADAVIVAGGYQALIAVLLAAAALELAVSVRTRHAAAHADAPTGGAPATASHDEPCAPGRAPGGNPQWTGSSRTPGRTNHACTC
jgi:MFS family permease